MNNHIYGIGEYFIFLRGGTTSPCNPIYGIFIASSSSQIMEDCR